MNYIDIVNAVLRKMREAQVSSLYENRQSSVVAEFVNDAKRIVEQAHDWVALREDYPITTAAGLGTYSLVGSGNRASIKDVRDITTGTMLRKVPAAYVRTQLTTSNSAETRPSYWATEGVDANGDTVIRLWGTPDDIYQIRVYAVVRQADLQSEGDEVVVPSAPIVLLTAAMAIEERGGVDSTRLVKAYDNADKSLAQHIMLDAALNPEEMIWCPE